ncbi:hypothetical protein EDD37DRAFT_142476 [Exophiala viscosa]|uniref:Mid2 domain-containing protein n=1 Tax=Exophiala viscosa TaxID=2486360 RepID=A0AAN6I9V2_9EURO|nr:hypothetical protein EDD36DRAFT_86249 [Exophiala viscosa]KAI1621032.1 hypothetical protein EDD37DRAFT_142476 [Exophiala viscosa]
MSPRKALGAVVLIICLCNALPSVPVATNPIITTATVSTVVPSLLTIYSVVPATEQSDTTSVITTTINGQQTTLTPSDSVVAGSVTSTIISTISITTTEVVVKTIGYSTVLGPDTATSTISSTTSIPITNTTVSSSSPATSIAISQTPTSQALVQTISTTGIVSSSTIVSASSRVSSTSTQDIISSSSTTSSASSTASTISALSKSSSHSLSAGAKAGIGIGVAVGVLGLIVGSFCLGRRVSRRSKAEGAESSNDPAPGITEEKDAFRAGRPYEDTAPTKLGARSLSPKNGYSGTTTEVGSGSLERESISTSSPTMPAYQYNNPRLSALPQLQDNDPMYVGVPSHMSGSKRWSMKEYEM